MIIFYKFMPKCAFTIIFVIGIFFKINAQELIPVDLHTGTANVSIPLHILQENDLSIPIGIY